MFCSGANLRNSDTEIPLIVWAKSTGLIVPIYPPVDSQSPYEIHLPVNTALVFFPGLLQFRTVFSEVFSMDLQNPWIISMKQLRKAYSWIFHCFKLSYSVRASRATVYRNENLLLNYKKILQMCYLTDIRDFVVDFFISCTTDLSYCNKKITFVWVSLFQPLHTIFWDAVGLFTLI